MRVFTKNAAIRLVIGVVLVMCSCAGLLNLINPARSIARDISAAAFLKSETGIVLNDAWHETSSGDEHAGFVGDGETFAVFHLDQDATDQLIQSRPPWSKSWQSGPVPGDIGFHCKFGTDGVSFGGPLGGPGSYTGDESLVKLLSSKQIVFDAKERCCDTRPWHNGHLLVVDPESQTVWLSVWDF